jgi:hypothetical protein
MPQCSAITQRGTQCTRAARENGRCGTHNNVAAAAAPANVNARLAARAHIHMAERRARQEEMARMQAVAAALEADRKREKTQKALDEAERMNIGQMSWYVDKLANLWYIGKLMNRQFIQAYVLMKSVSPRHHGFPALMRAIVQNVRMGYGLHPYVRTYAATPEAEKLSGLDVLKVAINEYDPPDVIAYLTKSVGPNDYQYCNQYKAMERALAKHEMRMNGLVSRLVPSERGHCALTLDDIALGGLYCECAACKNCFDQEMLDTALANKETCPLCRSPWTNWIIYRNSEPTAPMEPSTPA